MKTDHLHEEVRNSVAAELEAKLDKAATEFIYAAIPTSLVEGILRYAYHGIPPGSFLQAVLSNDLFDAVGRADAHSLRALKALVTYCYMELPEPCWGSREKVAEWLQRFEDGI